MGPDPLATIRRGLFLLPTHGQGVFSPVYIDDLVDGIVLAAGSPKARGHIFNLLGPAPAATGEFFAHHARRAGKSGPPRSLSTAAALRIAAVAAAPARLAGRPLELSPQTMRMLAKAHMPSGEKARRVLGYAPRVELAEGMRRTEAWLRKEEHLGSD